LKRVLDADELASASSLKGGGRGGGGKIVVAMAGCGKKSQMSSHC